MTDIPVQDESGVGGEEYPHREKYAHRIIARLYRRQDWQLPEHAWSKVPEILMRVVEQGEPREIVAASRVLVAMAQSNQQGVGVDARVNTQLGSVIDVPPESPEDVDLDVQEAFYEVVSPDSKREMLLLAEEMGLTERLLGQQQVEPHKNGNGKP